MRWRRYSSLALGSVLLVGCTGDGADSTHTDPEPTAVATSSSTSPPTPTQPTAPDNTTPAPDAASTAVFSSTAAMRSVRHLANDIGPRAGTSPAFAVASDWVQRQFEKYGYAVERQWFRAPAGNSWGIDVPAGRSNNVIATTPGFDSGKPHLIIGAHLDTVPQAPGAEDNASGVSVVLELARMASITTPRLPVVFVAFGSEEPRGSGDDQHHFGSRIMVDRLSPAQRQALVAMVSLDRAGVGHEVPVSAGGLEPPTVRNQLLKAADRIGVPAFADTNNQASDHWSFDKAGLPAARIGSTPYAGYHNEGDLPAVVNPAQLERVGNMLWTWLAGEIRG